MVAYAFDLGIWTTLFFLLGMYKPEWPLFFLAKPSRFLILIITTVFIMITFTLYGEGVRREKVALEEAAKVSTQKGAENEVPVPTPAPEKPAVPVAPATPATPKGK